MPEQLVAALDALDFFPWSILLALACVVGMILLVSWTEHHR